MLKKTILSLWCAAGLCHITHAQQSFPGKEYLDINQVKASVLVHGDLWHTNDTVDKHDCEFPIGSGRHIGFCGALWMAGYDNNQQLHVAAQTSPQTYSGGPIPVDAGKDYWPGPLDANATISYTESGKWARIWKVNYSDITSFSTQSTHTLLNTPASILEWPAKGNPYAKGNNNTSLAIAADMAPFVDVNSDGTYNPLNGDYPAIKGDQALWWVFNDNGTTHNASTGTPLKVEIHAMAYGYHRGGAADNILFYEYNIINRSGYDYDSCRVGIWADMDLGYAFDDYIGFDSATRTGIVYNGKKTDGSGQADAYGMMIPVAGITVLEMPGESCTNHDPAGCFNAPNFSFGSNIAVEVNHCLRARGYNGTPLPGGVKYLFPDDPSIVNGESECSKNINPDDVNILIASGDKQFANGSTAKFSFALVVTQPDTNSYCPVASFSAIKTMADSAARMYCNPLPAGVENLQPADNAIEVYPNPAKDLVRIKTTLQSGDVVFTLSDVTGRIVLQEGVTNNTIINISNLPAALYIYRVSVNGMQRQIGKLLKQ